MNVLKIGAVWCPGCLVMKPRWEEIEKENSWLKTEYFEFDDHPEIIEKYNLSKDVIPVFIFISKEGDEILRISGERAKDELVKIINENKNR